MPRNIEIKLRLDQPESTHSRIRSIADGPPALLEQHDIFFHVPRGRLKLRIFPNRPAELIAYHRPDGSTPRASLYSLVLIEDAEGLVHTLSTTIGIRGEVHKSRLLYRLNRTRIHFDHVEDLGYFLELEVEMGDTESDGEGLLIAKEILSQLALKDAEVIDRAYIDLLLQGNREETVS